MLTYADVCWFSGELDKSLAPLFTLSQFVQELPIFWELPFKVGARGSSGAAPPLAGKVLYEYMWVYILVYVYISSRAAAGWQGTI